MLFILTVKDVDGAVHLLRSELVSNSTQISSQHLFSPLERQVEVQAAPLCLPGLAMCPKCHSEWQVTDFYTADAVQMATPAPSSKKVENLLCGNCHLHPKATI